MIVHVLVVNIDLNQTAYEIMEDAGSVEVCAILSGPGIERNLMVFLITLEDTAQGSVISLLPLHCYHTMCLFTADDFEGGDRVLSLSPSVSTSCVSIGVFSDNLVEGDELFNVSLLIHANQTFAELGSSTATVTIIDSDGGI